MKKEIMTMDKEELLNEYSDDIARVIVHMYEEVKEEQENSYYTDIENGISEREAGKKTYDKTRAQLDILMKLMKKLDEKFPEHMAISCIMTNEQIDEA